MVVTYEGLVAFVVMLCTVIALVIRIIEFVDRRYGAHLHDAHDIHEQQNKDRSDQEKSRGSK